MYLSELLKTKRGKQIATFVGVTVLILSGVHYYYRIKATRLEIEHLEEENKKDKAKK